MGLFSWFISSSKKRNKDKTNNGKPAKKNASNKSSPNMELKKLAGQSGQPLSPAATVGTFDGSDNLSFFDDSVASSMQDDYEYRNIFRDDSTTASEADATHGETSSRFSSDTSLNSGFTNIFCDSPGLGTGGDLLGNIKGDDGDDDDSLLLWNNDKYTPLIERQYQVAVPVGAKSGMILDTNPTDNTSFPTIHQLKPNSILLKIEEVVSVGDKLLSVDGHDCRYLTATQIGKLISHAVIGSSNGDNTSDKPKHILTFSTTTSSPKQ